MATTVIQGASTIFQDSFNRANGDIGSGSNYTVLSGSLSFNIINNTIRASTSTPLTARVTVSTASAVFGPNQEASITYQTSFNADTGGPMVRADATNGHGYFFNGDTNNRTIGRLVSGSTVGIGTTSFPVASGDTIKLRVVGTTLTIYRNGRLMDTVTDTTLSSGQPGISYAWSNIGATRLDNFVASNVTANTTGIILVGTGGQKIFTDNFNRANGDIGSNYTTMVTGSGLPMSIINNQVRGSSTLSLLNTVSSISTSSVVFGPNQEAQVTYTAVSDFDFAGPAIRVDPIAGNAYYIGLDGRNVHRIAKLTAGVATTIGSVVLPANLREDTYKLRAVGNVISVFKNGILLDSVVDNSFSTGQPGMFYKRENNNASYMDNFVASEVIGEGKSLVIIGQ